MDKLLDRMYDFLRDLSMAKNKIKLVDESNSTPEKEDFRAELAALIKSNNSKPHADVKLLETVSSKILKITDDLVTTRIQYLKLHNIKDTEECTSYDVNAVQLGITYAIHECHKIISLMEKELSNAKMN